MLECIVSNVVRKPVRKAHKDEIILIQIFNMRCQFRTEIIILFISGLIDQFASVSRINCGCLNGKQQIAAGLCLDHISHCADTANRFSAYRCVSGRCYGICAAVLRSSKIGTQYLFSFSPVLLF